MPRINIPNTSISYGWFPREQGWSAGMNLNMQVMGQVAKGSVLSRSVTEPPETPSEGDGYIVPVAATGDWAGEDNKQAVFLSDTWVFIEPLGMPVYVQDEDAHVCWKGSGYVFFIVTEEDAVRAEIAADEAETAEAGAETARAAAVTAQSAAETAQTGAETAETNAAASASAAATSASDAQAYADAAAAAPSIYADTAAGLAATIVDDYFYVPSASDGELLVLYRHDAGPAATEIGRSMSSGVVAALQKQEVLSYGSRNLFNLSDYEDDKYVSATTGALASSTLLFVTGFIPVVFGQTIVSSSDSWSNANSGIAFYDESKNFLSGSTTTMVANTPYGVPYGAYFVRISFEKAFVDADSLMVSIGSSVPAEYQPYFGDVYGRDAIASAHRSIVEGRGSLFNLLNYRDVTEGYFTNGSGGLTANSGYFSSGYIAVIPGGQITMSVGNPGASAAVQFFDYKQDFVSAVSGAFLAGDVFSVPDNAFYTRVSFQNASMNIAQVLNGAVTAGKYTEAAYALLKHSKPWAEKKFANFGDSISSVNNWFRDITDEMQAVQAVNATRSGRTTEDFLKHSTNLALVEADISDVDVAFIFLGSNDWKLSLTKGNPSDAPGTGTFCARYKAAVEQLIAWQPTILICAATYIYRINQDVPNSSGDTLEDFNDAVREMANIYGMPVCDLARHSSFNKYTMVDNLIYSDDGTHPNSAGESRLRAYITAFFNTLIPDY